MASSANSFVFYRSWFEMIEEWETDEEKLAAYRTLCQMAFQGEENFVLPEKPQDGKMSPVLHAIRNIYHSSRCILWKGEKVKNERCVAAGKMGGRGRKKSFESDSTIDYDIEEVLAKEKAPQPSPDADLAASNHLDGKSTTPIKDDLVDNPTVNSQPIGGPDIINGVVQSKFASIIKSPKDLQSWIQKNWMGACDKLVRSDGFSEWAYEKLVESNWRLYQSNRPITNLGVILGKLKIGYKKYIEYVVPKQKEEEEHFRKLKEEKEREEAEQQNQLTDAEIWEIRQKRLAATEPDE